MAFLNANIPPTYAQIRREYLYDCKKHHGEVEDCIVFGITSMGGRAILWHALMENGAIFYRLPISALSNAVSKSKTYHEDDWMNWSFGILLAIILLLLVGLF